MSPRWTKRVGRAPPRGGVVWGGFPVVLGATVTGNNFDYVTLFLFVFFYLYVPTQLAHQLHQERTQVW